MYSTLFQTFAIGAALVARQVLAADLAVLTPTLIQVEVLFTLSRFFYGGAESSLSFSSVKMQQFNSLVVNPTIWSLSYRPMTPALTRCNFLPSRETHELC